jgi:hypothetical protein
LEEYFGIGVYLKDINLKLFFLFVQIESIMLSPIFYCKI